MNETEQVRHQTVMDDETRHVARVYAEALYRAAEQTKQTDEAMGELESLAYEVFRKDPGLELFLGSAAISQDRKQAVIEKAFAGRATEVFVNFLKTLNHHGRLDMLRAIAQAFHNLHERRAGKVQVHVRSAVPLTDAERDRVREDVRAVSQREPVVHETVDPSILGGLVIRVDDWVYDASVRTRLLNIRDQVIERSSHAIASGRDHFGN